MASHLAATSTVTIFPERRSSWRRLRVLLHRTWAANTSTQFRSRRTTIKVLEDPTLSSDESVSEPAVLTDAQSKAQTALVVSSKGQYEIRDDFPVPDIGDEEVMIRSHYVGLNPIDWKSVDYNFCLPSFPWVTGREMSGEVVRVGKAVKGISHGDKVWTSTYYRDARAGCFQQYVVVPSHTVLPVPKRVSMEAAACLGVAALTACMTLWKWLDVPLPSTSAIITDKNDDEKEWILIWGGSTVTGQFATQLAVLSGLRVVTVNSQQTAELSKKLGAECVVVRDEKTPEQIIDEIREITGGRITRAIDIVGHRTAALVLKAVSEDLPVGFAPLAMMSAEQPIPANVTVHTVEMKRFVLDSSSERYAVELNKLLSQGRLQLPEIQVLDGGFVDIIRGLDILKKGNMGGKKLVVQL